MGDVVAALQQVGYSRVEAVLLAYLLDAKESDTKSIIAKTGLRQPEVSVGIRSLREQWLDVEPIPREGKGRPMHKYRLKDRGALVRHLSKQADQKVQQLHAAVATIQAA